MAANLALFGVLVLFVGFFVGWLVWARRRDAMRAAHGLPPARPLERNGKLVPWLRVVLGLLAVGSAAARFRHASGSDQGDVDSPLHRLLVTQPVVRAARFGPLLVDVASDMVVITPELAPRVDALLEDPSWTADELARGRVTMFTRYDYGPEFAFATIGVTEIPIPSDDASCDRAAAAYAVADQLTIESAHFQSLADGTWCRIEMRDPARPNAMIRFSLRRVGETPVEVTCRGVTTDQRMGWDCDALAVHVYPDPSPPD